MKNKQKVLIVDDNNTNIKFIADVLKELDYISLVFATNGYKAIEIVDDTKIDMILMDINMPDIDGFETVKRMNTTIPIIYVTALDDKQSVLKAFDNGGVDYITKPFYPQELIARVTTHLKLIKLNQNLESEVEIQIKKNKEKEKILMHQSRLASMGEMIDAIAHQWQQPIQLIKLRIGLLSHTFENGIVDKKYMQKFEDKISTNIDHMVATIDEFRTFFRPNKETKVFAIITMIEKALILIEDEFKNNKINIEINEIDDFYITGVENEFKHMILNLLNNAKDAFNDNDISFDNRKIIINIKSNKNTNLFEIIDNAGGISKELIENIFNANITTKDNKNGTGIGLYLCNQIAQKYNGILKVENTENGAKFTYEQKR